MYKYEISMRVVLFRKKKIALHRVVTFLFLLYLQIFLPLHIKTQRERQNRSERERESNCFSCKLQTDLVSENGVEQQNVKLSTDFAHS